MKKLSQILCIMALILGIFGMAYGLPYTDTFEFESLSTGLKKSALGRICIQIDDTVNPIYTHTVSFDPAALEITSATLTLSHLGNDSTRELWFITDSGNNPIGKLSDSAYDSSAVWVDQDFTIPPSYFGVGGSWSLELRIKEGSANYDAIHLDKSVLHGDYNPVTDPVPESSTWLLILLGLAGMVGVKKKFS